MKNELMFPNTKKKKTKSRFVFQLKMAYHLYLYYFFFFFFCFRPYATQEVTNLMNYGFILEAENSARLFRVVQSGTKKQHKKNSSMKWKVWWRISNCVWSAKLGPAVAFFSEYFSVLDSARYVISSRLCKAHLDKKRTQHSVYMWPIPR